MCSEVHPQRRPPVFVLNVFYFWITCEEWWPSDCLEMFLWPFTDLWEATIASGSLLLLSCSWPTLYKFSQLLSTSLSRPILSFGSQRVYLVFPTAVYDQNKVKIIIFVIYSFWNGLIGTLDVLGRWTGWNLLQPTQTFELCNKTFQCHLLKMLQRSLFISCTFKND